MARTPSTVRSDKQTAQYRKFCTEIVFPATSQRFALNGMTRMDVVKTALHTLAASKHQRISLREVQSTYGIWCARLFTLLFIKFQVGGYSEVAKVGYETMWIYNDDPILQRDVFALTMSGDHSPKLLFEELTKLGHLPVERVKLVDEKGAQQVFFASGEQLEKLKSAKKAQNSVFRETREKRVSKFKQMQPN